MHVNMFKPNILQDMIAASNGRDLKNRSQYGILTASRHQGPRRYPYSSKRQQGRYAKLAQRSVH